MSSSSSLVRQLQAEALDTNVQVSDLLRKAKVIATKLDLKDALVWIDRELNGYIGFTTEELPEYRRLTGQPKGWNPYHGWQPIHFQSSKNLKLYSQAPLGQALGAIEEGLREKGDHIFAFPYPPEIKTNLMKAIDFPTDVCIHLDNSALFNIVESVRNLVLEWSLELEKAGIIGENMTFSVNEKKEATPITQQFFAQSIGVVGDLRDNALVSNVQTSTIDVNLDIDEVRDLVEQIRSALTLVPEQIRSDLESSISELEIELDRQKPSQSKLYELLSSAKSMCEGASGNLAAQGILGMIEKLFS